MDTIDRKRPIFKCSHCGQLIYPGDNVVFVDLGKTLESGEPLNTPTCTLFCAQAEKQRYANLYAAKAAQIINQQLVVQEAKEWGQGGDTL